MNQLAQACQGLNKCIGIINRNIHDDIDAQRAANRRGFPAELIKKVSRHDPD